MLVQTPSKIFRSDLAFWTKIDSCSVKEYAVDSVNCNAIRIVRELVIGENGIFKLQLSGERRYFLMVLFGHIQIKALNLTFSAGETLYFQKQEMEEILIKNNLTTEKADILIFEMEADKNDHFHITEKIELKNTNTLIKASEHLPFNNFIGLYEGRKEEVYFLKNTMNPIFGMVLNGAFEFQNRLLEERDAILLWEIEKLEFEALSNNAIVIFFECNQ